MISQALSICVRQNSAKSGASKAFQFQTGNSQTIVKTRVTPSAEELGGRMIYPLIKPSILCGFSFFLLIFPIINTCNRVEST